MVRGNTFWIFSAVTIIVVTNLLHGCYCADLLGPADMIFKSIEQCPDPEQYPYKLDVIRHKHNRTHEVFDGSINLDRPFDSEVGVQADVAKWGDGGWKPFWDFSDDYACEWLMKWVGNGYKEVLQMLGEPETCPLKPGDYNIKNYLIDYRELPNEMVYGEFQVDGYAVIGGKKVMCLRVYVDSKPKQIF